jgi:signal transduction histidine kinase/CHASE3 domain sensor protein
VLTRRWALIGLVLLLWWLYSLSTLTRAPEAMSRAPEVRLALGQLRSTVLDAETGMRAFAVGGNTRFLEPYNDALGSWRSKLDGVRSLISDDAAQQASVKRLQQLIETEFQILGGIRTKYDAGMRGGELSESMLAGKGVMDETRAAIRGLELDEERLDAARQDVAVRHRRLRLWLVVGNGLAFLVLVTALWLLQRRNEARQRQAAQVKGEHGLLQSVLAGIEDGVTMQDRAGKLIFANASAARLIGFPSPEALLAAPTSELMARFQVFDDQGQPFPVEKLPARLILEGRATEAAALIHFRPRASGDERWSNLRAYAVRGPKGHVDQVINVFRDVTAEHQDLLKRAFLLRAVEELNASLDYSTTLATTARLAVPMLGDWCAIDIVRGDEIERLATAHVDPAKVSLVGEITRRYPPDPNAPGGAREILRTGKPLLIAEIPQERLAAAAIDAEHLKLIEALQLRSVICVPMRAGTSTLGLVTFAMAESGRRYAERDLAFGQQLADAAALAVQNARLFGETERARAAVEAQLASEGRRREQAESAARFAEMFVGILGHDLRNPLTSILMGTRVLKRQTTGHEEVIERITSSAKRMTNMVSQLLDLTRSRLGGGIPVDLKPIDLAPVVTEAIAELRTAHPDRQILWRPSEAEAKAMADGDRLAQVVSNLVGNALEHGDRSKPVTVELVRRGSRLALSVHNEGPPIAPEVLEGIFDPFRDVSSTRLGLGLGLFISQQITLSHKGDIEVRSTAEAGTMFTVVLPELLAGQWAEGLGKASAASGGAPT